ncbi:MAG: hypothetical protein NVSMB14_17340 [Isosphaeraceae bacterium]
MRARTFCAAIGLCVFLTSAAAFVRAKNSGEPQDDNDRVIQSLAKQRLEISRTVFKHQVDRQMANAEVVIRNFDDMSIWSKHWMEDEIRIDSHPQARLLAIHGHFARMKTVEDRMMKWFKAGQIRESDALKANYYRLEAETMLLETQRVERSK